MAINVVNSGYAYNTPGTESQYAEGFMDNSYEYAAAGNAILSAFYVADIVTASVEASSGTGWTKIVEQTNADGTLVIFCKTHADAGYLHGNTKADYLKIDWGISTYVVGLWMVIEGAGDSFDASAFGYDNDPDSPSLNTGTNQEYIWFTIAGYSSNYAAVTPSGWSVPDPNGDSRSSPDRIIYVAYKVETAQTVDPAAWDVSAEVQVDWSAATVALAVKSTADTGDLKIRIPLTELTATGETYGIRTYDSSGVETMSSFDPVGSLLALEFVEDTEEGYFSVPAIADYDCIAIAVPVVAAGSDTWHCPHFVWIDEENCRVYYELPDDAAVTVVDSWIMVFTVS